MGSVKYKESSVLGEAASFVEYEFSDATDFFAFDEYRAERMTNAVKSFANAMYADPDGRFEEPAPMVADVVVTKKPKETKH